MPADFGAERVPDTHDLDTCIHFDPVAVLARPARESAVGTIDELLALDHP